MTTYRANRFILRDKHTDLSLLLISLNKIKGRKGREHHLFHERWADILYDIGIDHYAILLLPVVSELRDPYQSTRMIRGPWPAGFFDGYYKQGFVDNCLAIQATNANRLYPWSENASGAELDYFRQCGIKSGLIVPSVIDQSHCALICADTVYNDDTLIKKIKPHLDYIKTALTITHQNILQNYYDLYTPYTFELSRMERKIFNLKRYGLSYREIGSILHKSESDIKYHISKVSERLKTLDKGDKTITKIERMMPLFIRAKLI